jgi:hypothetical protein
VSKGNAHKLLEVLENGYAMEEMAYLYNLDGEYYEDRGIEWEPVSAQDFHEALAYIRECIERGEG